MVKRASCAVAIGFLLAFMGDVGNCFVPRTLPPFANQNAQRRTRNQASAINMALEGIDHDVLSIRTVFAPAQSIILSKSLQNIITSDPQLEAELMNDVSHVALDFTTFVSPNTAWVRLCSVLGRVLIISSDYIQDHYIPPEEALFQFFMLAISIQMFWKSACPVILAASSKTSLSVRDRRAFSQLFREVDVSALQFKTLLTSQALEWVELEHDEEVHLNGDHMYWLHSGHISSPLHENCTSPSDNTTLQISHRMFGVLLFAKALEEYMSKVSKKRAKSEKVKVVDGSNKLGSETLIAGPNGAILLRISTSELLKAMDHDGQLSDSINRLILLCMQEKLARTFHKGDWKKTNCDYDT
ncbi:hypothetical protein ACHAW6_009306 [Cyclotella cf. meneghiniana]